MSLQPGPAEDGVLAEAGRYVVNGLIATCVHYGALLFNMDVLQMASAGVANLCAAVVGITASFMGSRYFVFRRHRSGLLEQAAKFALLYGAIALVHGLALYLWTDLGQLDYRPGFVIALVLQVTLSYWGNKRLIFR
jgi:putative flippase GtrA